MFAPDVLGVENSFYDDDRDTCMAEEVIVPKSPLRSALKTKIEPLVESETQKLLQSVVKSEPKSPLLK